MKRVECPPDGRRIEVEGASYKVLRIPSLQVLSLLCAGSKEGFKRAMDDSGFSRVLDPGGELLEREGTNGYTTSVQSLLPWPRLPSMFLSGSALFTAAWVDTARTGGHAQRHALMAKTAAHEAMHVLGNIGDCFGFAPHKDELGAYLMGWLVAEFTELLYPASKKASKKAKA